MDGSLRMFNENEDQSYTSRNKTTGVFSLIPIELFQNVNTKCSRTEVLLNIEMKYADLHILKQK